MLPRFILLFLIISTNHLAWSKTELSDLNIKKELLTELKILFSANHNRYDLKAAKSNHFQKTFNLFISDAYAQSQYQCLYGGWPSNTKKYSGRMYCHDAKKSDYYRHSYSCKSNELTCAPLLFGKDVCVPYGTLSQRKKAYSQCSKNEKKVNLDLKIPSEEHNELMEYVKIADDICHGEMRANIKRINCDQVDIKVKAYENRLRLRNKELVKEIKQKAQTNLKKKVVVEKTNIKKTIKDCLHCEKRTVATSSSVDQIAIDGLDERIVYDELKTKFRSGPLCSPEKSYAPEEVTDHALLAVGKLLDECRTFGRDIAIVKLSCERSMQKLSSILKVTNAEKLIWSQYRDKYFSGHTDSIRKLNFRIKKLVLKENRDDVISKLSTRTYESLGVLAEDEQDGVMTCPFPSFDAFSKAFKGYKKLKHKLGKKHLTIADYTMPSAQRRLFTFDMNSLEVIHNTWVSHGSGTNGMTSDEFGANPSFSNASGSNLSSDGFIIAKSQGNGAMYGKNLILEGIDENNKNIRSRAIILHGDSKTGGGYKVPYYSKETLEEKKEKLLSGDENTMDIISMRQGSSYPTSFLPPNRTGETWGCLGVPDQISFDIKTQSYKSQLDTLRRDLSGNTLIFSYSGEQMDSKYF